MAKVIEKSAKTVEEALKAALEELGVSEKEVEYDIVEEASKGFLGIIGSKPAKIRVTVKEDERKGMNFNNTTNNQEDIEQKVSIPDETRIEIAKNFLQAVLKGMKLEVEIEAVATEEDYIFNIKGENLGILIGKHGQTLDALQYLVNLATNKNEINRVHFVVDVENYRVRRADTLQSLARNLADRAIRMNQSVKLEPMNRYERKIIHTSLKNDDKITTYSKGEEPYRYIVISPKK